MMRMKRNKMKACHKHNPCPRRPEALLRWFIAVWALAAFLGAGAAAPGKAWAAAVTSINNLTDFTEWYEKRGAEQAKLKNHLVINETVTLDQERFSLRKELAAGDCFIRILKNGSLEIDDENFELTGKKKLIVVETGGTLILKRGAIRGDEDETVLILGAGAVCKKNSEDFTIIGKVEDKRNSSETQPSGGSSQPVILGVDGAAPSVACMEGDSLSSLALPAKVTVSYMSADGQTGHKELPVSWDTSEVDTRASGVYKVKGIFSKETLAQNQLSNPGQVSASLLVSVMKAEDAGTLNVRMISEDSAGNTVVRLEFPMLTSDVTALYLYSSADGEHFSRESWSKLSDSGAIVRTENFMDKCAGNTDPPWQYLEYKRRPGGQFWLQIEVAGSALAGKSNVVACDSLEEREPGHMKVYRSSGSGSAEGSGAAAGVDSALDRGSSAWGGTAPKAQAGGLSGGALQDAAGTQIEAGHTDPDPARAPEGSSGELQEETSGAGDKAGTGEDETGVLSQDSSAFMPEDGADGFGSLDGAGGSMDGEDKPRGGFIKRYAVYLAAAVLLSAGGAGMILRRKKILRGKKRTGKGKSV